MNDQIIDQLNYATRVMGNYSDVVKVATRYVLHDMSAEVAMAEITAILGKENN